MGHIDKALTVLNPEPDSRWDYWELPTMELAEIFIAAGRSRDLVEWLQELPQRSGCVDSSVLPVVMRTADALEAESEIDLALDLLSSYMMPPVDGVFSGDPRLDARLRSAVLLVDNGRPAEAEAMYDTLRQQVSQKDSRAAIFETGIFLANRGGIGRIHDFYSNVTDVSTSDPGIRQLWLASAKAQAVAATGDPELAIEIAGRLGGRFPAQLMELAGDSDGAARFLVRYELFHLPIGSWPLKRHLTGLYYRSGKMAEAVAIFRFGIEPNGRPSEPWSPAAGQQDLMTKEQLDPEEFASLGARVHIDFNCVRRAASGMNPFSFLEEFQPEAWLLESDFPLESLFLRDGSGWHIVAG